MFKRRPLSPEIYSRAQIPGIPMARCWSDEPPPYTKAWLDTPKEELHSIYSGIVGREHHYLAISGGGSSGAFGAGLLKGWTAAGTRPEFTLVTGISTGALTAPFAFLGPDWDDTLEELYTRYSTKDLVRQNPLVVMNASAMFNTHRLQGMIAKYMNGEVLEAIAREFRDKGRGLDIGTTNLDALRPVTWSISRIAASNHPEALNLIRKILLASSSIPIAFPPVHFDVEVDGKHYEELHVDGGATAQVFLYPTGLDWKQVKERLDVQGNPDVYLIRNSCIAPEWAATKPRAMSIGLRTMTSLIRTQGIGDMFRVYLQAQRDGLDFFLAHIPDDFTPRPTEQFDPVYMRKLFDLGYQMAESGYPWERTPTGF
jgi:hypothetical protein